MIDWSSKMSCRNTKKLTKAKWLLGKECAENVAVEWKDRVPRMSWIMNDKIKRWGITWRDSTPTNASVSLGINGDLGSALMMSHGMTLLALREVQDEFFRFALAALVAVHSIQAGDGEDDYVAVVLDATLCHMEMCAGAQERGFQFPEGFAEDCEEVLVAFSSVEASMEQVNKECAEAAAKPTKKTRGKKSDAAGGGHEIGDEIAATGESSHPKCKSTSASDEREASRAKKGEGKLTLAAAIFQANNKTAKTKPADVEAMYKSLEEGLGQCFPYGQDPLPCKIRQTRFISLQTHQNTACSWRRGRTRFSWRQRHSVRSEESWNYIAFRSSEPQLREAGQRTKGRG